MNSKEFSLIIPTQNSFTRGKGTLELTLMALELQGGQCQGEFIIVDRDSTDETLSFLRIFQEISLLHVKILSGGPTLEEALEKGVAAASGRNLLFLEDNMLFPEKESLSRLLSCPLEILIPGENWERDRVYNELLGKKFTYLESLSHPTPGLPLVCGALSRKEGESRAFLSDPRGYWQNRKRPAPENGTVPCYYLGPAF